jgi:hypothetical protein
VEKFGIPRSEFRESWHLKVTHDTVSVAVTLADFSKRLGQEKRQSLFRRTTFELLSVYSHLYSGLSHLTAISWTGKGFFYGISSHIPVMFTNWTMNEVASSRHEMDRRISES